MSTRSVIHDTFTIVRTYPATPSRVFAAFASEEAKNAWGDTGDLEPAEGAAADDSEFDFRVGGRERFGHKYQGTTYLYDGRYYDIVPDQRIIYAYEMYANDTWTEQGAYLDGVDGPQAPALRTEGTAEILDGLARYLTRHA